jgi:uncharacterized protein
MKHIHQEKKMTLSMYQASVPVVTRAMKALQGVLEKGKAHAATKKTDEANYLTMRLAPDMLPLAAQVKIASDIARRCACRLAGVEPPTIEDKEASFDDLIARCQASIDYLATFKPEQIDGSENREVILQSPNGELKFTGKEFLFGFVLANVHFHSSMAYALLRGAGVVIGKKDYLGGA